MSPGRVRRRKIARPEDASGSQSGRERPPPPPAVEPSGSRFGLTTWIALLAGALAGRATTALPQGLSEAAGIVISLALAVTVTMAYRRWVRRAMAARRSTPRSR